MQGENKTEEYEICVCCGKQLNILCTIPIEIREHYIIGAGQLCGECYFSLGGTAAGGSYIISNSQMEYLIDRCQEK